MNTRVLIFAEAMTNAHVLRPWALALELDVRGYEVFFVTQSFFFKLGIKVPETITIIEIPTTIDSGYFIDEVSQGRFPFTIDVLRANIIEDERIIAEISPDLIISDFRLSLSISNRTLDIKQITLTNLYWSKYANITRPLPRGHIAAKICGGKLGDILFKIFQPMVFKQLAGPFNKILEERNLPKFKNLFEIHTFGTNVFYCDPHKFIPSKILPDNHLEIGPLCHAFSGAEFKELEVISKELPWIFIALGSSGPTRQLEKILKALSGLDNPIIVATSEELAMEGLSSNVWVRKYVPGDEVLRRSALFINNGGSAASYLALSYGVPTLGFPINIDQAMSSIIFKKRRVGDFLYSFNIEEFNKKVYYLLNNKDVRARCKFLQQQIERYKFTGGYWSIINNVQSRHKVA